MLTERDLLDNLPRLRRFALKLTRDRDAAEDLVQDTVARALKVAHQFQDGTNAGAWLSSITYSVFVNERRAAARRGIAVDLDAIRPPAAADDTEIRTYLREVGAALERLPSTQRRLLLRAALLGGDEKSYEALAHHEGVPVGTVRSRLSRGRAALRLMMHGAAVSAEELELLR